MKKVICMMCALCLFLFPMSVYAKEDKQENAITIEISELEYFQKLRACSDEVLEEEGMTQEQIDYIRNFDLVEAIKERASLSEATLKEMGHTVDEIFKMKSMLNRRNVSEEDVAKQVRGATLTLTVLSPTCSTSHFLYDYSFAWSSCPIFIQNDLLAATWAAVDSSGGYTAVAINKTFSDLTVKYKCTGGISNMPDETYKWDMKNEYSAAELEFDMGRNLGGGVSYWVYYGTGSLQFDASIPGTIHEFYLMLGYGHSVVTGTPSVSFSGTGLSVTFDFGITTQELAKYSRRCRYDGQYMS